MKHKAESLSILQILSKSEKTMTKSGKPLSKTDTGGGKCSDFLKNI